MSEQRIVKAVAGETAIHYHYDGEGRLISETDAATGETIRDYVWPGLTPIASFGAANDNGGGDDCADEIAALEADIADRTLLFGAKPLNTSSDDFGGIAGVWEHSVEPL